MSTYMDERYSELPKPVQRRINKYRAEYGIEMGQHALLGWLSGCIKCDDKDDALVTLEALTHLVHLAGEERRGY